MKVYKDNVEITNAVVQYGPNNLPARVKIGSAHSWRPAGDFEFKDDEPKVKTKKIKK